MVISKEVRSAIRYKLGDKLRKEEQQAFDKKRREVYDKHKLTIKSLQKILTMFKKKLGKDWGFWVDERDCSIKLNFHGSQPVINTDDKMLALDIALMEDGADLKKVLKDVLGLEL